jgi:uncharacterized RDD family membrane protein YckC
VIARPQRLYRNIFIKPKKIYDRKPRRDKKCSWRCVYLCAVGNPKQTSRNHANFMTPEKNVNAGIRLGSMILDHIFMTMIAMLFFIPTMIKTFSGAFTLSQNVDDGFSGPLLYIGLIGFALYFCKDCINGRSIAKRILKLQVVDNKTEQVASPLKCFVRNIFCIIWPVEVIVTLINPGRRIGDQVAGTKVVFYEPSIIEQPKVDIKTLLVPLALSFGLLLLIMLPFQSLKSSMTGVKYEESSYNDAESKGLEKVFTDSPGLYFTASVRVYDKIENQNLKYISIILQLKENYLENEANTGELQRLTMLAVHTQFPKNSFTGQVQYVYKSGGSMQTLTTPIGMRLFKPTKQEGMPATSGFVQ